MHGTVVDSDGEAAHYLFGKWTEAIYCRTGSQTNRCIWRAGTSSSYIVLLGSIRRENCSVGVIEAMCTHCSLHGVRCYAHSRLSFVNIYGFTMLLYPLGMRFQEYRDKKNKRQRASQFLSARHLDVYTLFQFNPFQLPI